MTPREPNDDRPLDETQAIGPADEPTQVMRDVDESTQVMRPAEEATQVMPDVEEQTRLMSRGAPVAAPPTERIALPAKRPVAKWVIATIVVFALITGVVAGYSQTTPANHNVVARALVRPDGGVMTFDETGRLEIPRGALPTPTAITIRREKLGRAVRLGPENDPRSLTYQQGELIVYVFEPSELRFQQPVTISLPRGGDASAVFVDARDSPRVIAAEPSGRTVKITTSSFTFQ